MSKTSFKDVKVFDLFDQGAQPMITVNKDTSVHDTLQVLYDTGILSVPVADQTMKVYPKHIAGFVDLLDILAYLIHVCEAYSISYGTPNALAHAFMHKPVGELIDFSSRDKFKAVLEEDDLLTVMGVLSHGTHRVGVMNVLNDIQNLVAQSDIVQLLALNVRFLGNDANKQVQDFGLTSRRLVVVNANDSALVSFKRMNDMRVSAAPIVNDHGVLVGTLSVSDLKGLVVDSFSSLLGSTLDFSQKHHYVQSVPVVCQPTDSFAKVVQEVALSRRHRVWIVDSTQKPVGVISLTDICRIAHTLAVQQAQ
jgi:CBS-domain-containing membrane protein